MLRLYRIIFLCGFASLAACASGTSTNTTTQGPTDWGDGAANLQIGLAVLQSSKPKPFPNQFVICLRNTGLDPIRIVCSPQALTDDLVVQSDQAEPPSAILTLSIARERGYLNFNVPRPDPPKLIELKSGQTLQIGLNLSVDLALHSGTNTLSFFARYFNAEPITGVWTGSIQSPSFTIHFVH